MVFLAEEGILLHVVVPAILFVTSVYSGSDWPSGWYGLPQPKTGCPSSSEWGRGWWYEDRRLNCQSTARVPQYSHLKGTFNQAITKRYFCIKKKDNGQDNPWPNGQYCIYKGLLRTCPPGFVQGSIGWKNKDAPNDNHHSGMVPSGVFSFSTRINYCCKVDGSKENSISLPVNRPFLLLAYNSSECQSVKWARTTQEYLRFSVQEKMTFRGFHPFVDDNYALRYCYYQNSNKTLTTSQGNISLYLNQTSVHQERHTAWCIKPYSPLPFQFLVVRFTRFTFHASNINSYLEVLDGCKESAPSLGRFSSTQSPLGRNITSSTNQVFVLLQFADRNGTYDFEFDYHIIPKVTTATTTLPLSSATSASATVSSTAEIKTTSHPPTPVTTTEITSFSPYTSSSKVTSEIKTTSHPPTPVTTTEITSFSPYTSSSKVTSEIKTTSHPPTPVTTTEITSSSPYTSSSKVTSIPTNNTGTHLHHHGNIMLLLYTLLPTGGLVVVLALMIEVMMVRRRRKRIAYSRLTSLSIDEIVPESNDTSCAVTSDKQVDTDTSTRLKLMDTTEHTSSDSDDEMIRLDRNPPGFPNTELQNVSKY